MYMGKDDTLVRAVESRLASDERTRDAAIEVSSLAGEVTLSGQVGSQAAKDAAEAVAQSTPGVTVVVNELTIETRDERDRTDGVPRAPVVVPVTGDMSGGGINRNITGR